MQKDREKLLPLVILHLGAYHQTWWRDQGVSPKLQLSGNLLLSSSMTPLINSLDEIGAGSIQMIADISGAYDSSYLPGLQSSISYWKFQQGLKKLSFAEVEFSAQSPFICLPSRFNASYFSFLSSLRPEAPPEESLSSGHTFPCLLETACRPFLREQSKTLRGHASLERLHGCDSGRS